ncbi:MAG: hypothetical protein JO108_32070 [Acidobacteriaceae bacterium]|nr:hypothetical protein [Acidobacteriaceae bacterium]
MECRLTASGVPIMKAGFDHAATQAISLAGGIARILQLSRQQAAHATAIATVGSAELATATRAA